MSRDTNPNPAAANSPAVIPLIEIMSAANYLDLAGVSIDTIVKSLASALVLYLYLRNERREGGEFTSITAADLEEASQEAVNAVGDRLGIETPAWSAPFPTKQPTPTRNQ
jgi:hypothetical protein